MENTMCVHNLIPPCKNRNLLRFGLDFKAIIYDNLSNQDYYTLILNELRFFLDKFVLTSFLVGNISVYAISKKF